MRSSSAASLRSVGQDELGRDPSTRPDRATRAARTGRGRRRVAHGQRSRRCCAVRSQFDRPRKSAPATLHQPCSREPLRRFCGERPLASRRRCAPSIELSLPSGQTIEVIVGFVWHQCPPVRLVARRGRCDPADCIHTMNVGRRGQSVAAVWPRFVADNRESQPGDRARCDVVRIR